MSESFSPIITQTLARLDEFTEDDAMSQNQIKSRDRTFARASLP
jgi:hypothetical protein